jgi:hypothetical protein
MQNHDQCTDCGGHILATNDFIAQSLVTHFKDLCNGKEVSELAVTSAVGSFFYNILNGVIRDDVAKIELFSRFIMSASEKPKS